MAQFIYLKPFLHYFLHFIFPSFIAWIFYKKEWKKVYVILLLTMMVDIDHLFADPIFSPGRNSIGYHYLHSYPAIFSYVLLFLFGKGCWKVVAIGLLFHMLTDFIDFNIWLY